MLRIGLTGGIASGKSTVAARLEQLGALLIDADVLAREVVAPGTPGLDAVAARFGRQVLTGGGELDRAALGALVFSDVAARRALEEIVHPLVRAAGQAAERGAAPDAVVVHDIPLLYEKGYAPTFHAVLVTEEETAERVRRMVETRGMTAEDASARLAAQASQEERRRVADAVLPGGEDIGERQHRVDRLWHERLRPWADNLARRAPVLPEPTVRVVHDPSWALEAARQLRRLRHEVDAAGLGPALLGMDHVGHTSIPGLAAEPVIDLQVRVRTWQAAAGARLRDAMSRAGFFAPAGGVAEPTVTFCGTDPARCWRVHVRVHDGAPARAALLLRDYLRAGVAARAGAAGEGTDLQRAEEWARATGWRGPRPR